MAAAAGVHRKFRTAVVGTGFIGPVHVEGLRRAGVDVAAVIGSSSEKSLAAAEQLQVNSAHRTLADVLDDRTIDAVHITTPNRLHFSQVSEVLRAGKHVLCEKPLAVTSEQSLALVHLAQQMNVAAGVAYNIRFYPLCHEAAERVRSGSLGEVLHVHGSYVQDWLLYDSDFNWRVLAEDGGELRALADIGTHWLDLIQFISGQHIVSICADLQTVHKTRRRPQGGVETFSGREARGAEMHQIPVSTDDGGSVQLRFENGAHGVLWVSQTTAGRKNCLQYELGGTVSALAWNSEVPDKLWIGHRDRPNQSLIRDPGLMGRMGARISSYPGGHNEGFPDTFKHLFRRFYEYIGNGDLNAPATFPTFLEAHREVCLCEAILESHRRRSWVDIRSFGLNEPEPC